jgi:hypothetical protein
MTDASVIMTKKNGNEERTAEIMVTFRTRRTEGIRVFDEALPLLGVFSLCVGDGESIPDTRVDFGHLWPLYNLDFALSSPWLFRVSRRHEWPRGVV